MAYLFISYSQDDLPAVTQLVTRLTRLYFEVWFPADVASPDAPAKIDDADVVLVMLSPAACASARVNADVTYAKMQRKRIIILQLAPTTAQERSKLGIDALPFIDFTLNPEAAFRTLLRRDLLPPPLDRDYRRLDSAFNELHRAYLDSLVRRCSPVNLSYLLDSTSTTTASLLDIYIPLNIGVVLNIRTGYPVDDWWLSTSGGQKPPGTLPKSLDNFTPRGRLLDALIDHIRLQKGTASKLYWQALDAETGIALMPQVVVTGDPGSGKSTVLKHLALCLADDMLSTSNSNLQRLAFWPLPAFTPLYIEMRELVSLAAPLMDEEITLDRLTRYLQTFQLTPYGVQPYLAGLLDQMVAGDVLFLLDGLDEVPQADDRSRREQIKAFVRMLRTQFPKCRIVVTSRPYAYAGDWTLEGFSQIHLAALDSDQLYQLAQRLFGIVLNSERLNIAVFQEQMLKIPETMRNTPLFFTLMLALWFNNRSKAPEDRLPTTKVAIYRDCIDILIRRWSHQLTTLDPSVGQELNDPQLRAILETLAYRIHQSALQEEDAVFTGQELFRMIQALGVREGLDTALLEAFKQHTGIIFEKAPNQFQFAHRSLQEYLAACYLCRPDHFPALCSKTIGGAPLHWRNVVALIADEAERQGQQLSLLVRQLLAANFLTVDRTDQAWCVYYAWHMLRDHLPEDERTAFQPHLVEWLITILEWGVLPVSARAELGRVLSDLGDSRLGVGLQAGSPHIAWCEVPAGSFIMGSHDQFNNPRRVVDLPLFKISKYPITGIQFQAFLDAPDGYQNEAWWAGLHEESRQKRAKRLHRTIDVPANHPIERVSWYEAMAYCAWLSAQLGRIVRLPTEEEWEKAARNGDERLYPWGNDYIRGYGNIDERWGSAYSLNRTTTVGLYPQGVSPYGVLDMSGNVWEWTLTDFWRASDKTLNTDAPRCIRGGSWHDYESFACTTYRHTRPPDYRGSDVGFRIVMA